MTKYGTVENNILTLAPRAIVVNGSMVANPKAEHFAVLNAVRAESGLPPYLPVMDEPPECEEGYHVVATGWETRDGAIHRYYEAVPNPPQPPRVWTPLAIKRACGERWAAIRAALEAAGIYEDFIMAQELRDDDAAFQMGYSWAVQNYGQEAVDAVLAAAEGGM